MALTIPPAYCTDQPYPFSIFRKQMASVASPGIVHRGDMTVSPASGLQVQISAGEAYVQQTGAAEGTSYNGLYYELNDAPANPFNTISAPLVNPRIDYVVLRVYDVTELGISGSSFARFEWVQGSENPSASLATMGPGLSNPGAPSLPASALLLAYALQTVGESSISSANILNAASLCGSERLWVPQVVTGSATVAEHKSVFAGPGSLTLPAPFVGAAVEILANASVTGALPAVVTYGTGAGKLKGLGLAAAGVTTFNLGTPGSRVLMYSYDGIDWWIKEGEQDTGWVSISAVNWTPVSGTYSPAVRVVGDCGYMRGTAVNGTGGSAQFITTVSAAFRPASEIRAAAAVAASAWVDIDHLGNLQAFPAVANGAGYGFDGVSWSLS